jgi:hypothetical protein
MVVETEFPVTAFFVGGQPVLLLAGDAAGEPAAPIHVRNLSRHRAQEDGSSIVRMEARYVD